MSADHTKKAARADVLADPGAPPESEPQTPPRSNLEEHAPRRAIIVLAGDIAARIAARFGIELDRVCVHESGHATAELALGQVPSEASVGPNGGHVRPAGWTGDLDTNHSDGEVIGNIEWVLANAGLSALNLDELRREAAALLREHWLFVSASPMSSRGGARRTE